MPPGCQTICSAFCPCINSSVIRYVDDGVQTLSYRKEVLSRLG